MRKRFERRTIGLFCILMAGIIGIMGSVYRIIGDEGILAAAAQQEPIAAPSPPFAERYTIPIYKR